MEKEDIDFTIRCPFCGGVMGWDNDFMTSDIEIEGRDRLVTYYTCTRCGATAEFIENEEE